jgi:hypothetical protein
METERLEMHSMCVVCIISHYKNIGAGPRMSGGTRIAHCGERMPLNFKVESLNPTSSSHVKRVLIYIAVKTSFLYIFK